MNAGHWLVVSIVSAIVSLGVFTLDKTAQILLAKLVFLFGLLYFLWGAVRVLRVAFRAFDGPFFSAKIELGLEYVLAGFIIGIIGVIYYAIIAGYYPVWLMRMSAIRITKVGWMLWSITIGLGFAPLLFSTPRRTMIIEIVTIVTLFSLALFSVAYEHLTGFQGTENIFYVLANIVLIIASAKVVIACLRQRREEGRAT